MAAFWLVWILSILRPFAADQKDWHSALGLAVTASYTKLGGPLEMHSRILSVLLLAMLTLSAGCHIAPVASTVPWWKGIPCMVIAPSSIEAEAWRRHLHGGDHCGSRCGGQGACEPMASSWPASIPFDETLPVPIESDQVDTAPLPLPQSDTLSE